MSSNGANFDYHEYTKYVKKLEIADKQFVSFLKRFLMKMAQMVIRNAKENTPIDTGTLRNSFVIGNEAKVLHYNSEGKVSSASYDSAFAQGASVKDIEVNGKTLTVTISNTAEYSSHVEYGHKGVYVPELGVTMWTDRRETEGHFMLTMAIDDIAKQIPARFKKEFEMWIKSMGIGD